MIADLLARAQLGGQLSDTDRQFAPSSFSGGGYRTDPNLIQNLQIPAGAQTMSLGQRMPAGGLQTGGGSPYGGAGGAPALGGHISNADRGLMTRHAPTQGLPPLQLLLNNPRFRELLMQLRGGGQRSSQGLSSFRPGGY